VSESRGAETEPLVRPLLCSPLQATPAVARLAGSSSPPDDQEPKPDELRRAAARTTIVYYRLLTPYHQPRERRFTVSDPATRAIRLLYTGDAAVTGGRSSRSSDGRHNVDLAVPAAGRRHSEPALVEHGVPDGGA
jgi:hypothetical protein